MRANPTSSRPSLARRDSLATALSLTGEPEGTAARTARNKAGVETNLLMINASLAYIRAIMIYLKHRGVMNVEEFRRANRHDV